MRRTISVCVPEKPAQPIRLAPLRRSVLTLLRSGAKRRIALGALAIYLLFFRGLGARDLWSSHEARAGMDAQMILDEGVWGLPRLYDGRPELQKPPLYYWLVAAVAWLRNSRVDSWAVRLPAAGAALLCVLAVGIGLASGQRRALAGLLAGVVLATAVHFTWLARIGRIDMPLTLSVTLAVGAMYLAEGRERWLRFAFLTLAYLGIAAGILLKGPIGFVLPGAVSSIHVVQECGIPTPQRWRAWVRALGERGLWWGIPLVAALTLPWFLWANSVTHGEFFHVFLWHHNLERGYGGSNLRTNPWWFYFPQFIADFLPWSPLFLLAVAWMVRRGNWRLDTDARFGLTWFLTVLLLLTCARFKRADYLLPAYPGAAILLGCIGERWLHRLADSKKRIAAAFITTMAGIMVVLWLVRVEWQLPSTEPYRDYRSFAERVRRLAPRPQEVLFFRTEAHPLAFHLGRPLAIIVEWGELNARLLAPGSHYVVTPPFYAEECARFVRGVRLEPVLRNTDLSSGSHEHPLVLLRTVRSLETETYRYAP
jgi:4-amino-4-deoxy-L-arabinose transferase-like glycosyltransferase